ncbi:MAG: protein kinase [Verrucomicrobiota bacterium]
MENKEEASVWTPPSPDDLAGEFPKLEIRSLLALGGMSAVYLVRQESLDRLAVLKVLPLSMGVDTEASSRFQTEARALASVRDQSVVEVYDFGRTGGGYLYLLLEYEGGGDLRGWLRNRTAPVTSAEALGIGASITGGLAAAHRKGIIHGDIKPDNIFLDDEGRLKVGDFGLAASSGSSVLTHHTPGYTAPEILAADRLATPQSDIYAVGATLFELLLGETPSVEPGSRAAALEKLPRPVAEVIGWAMRENPADRPASAHDYQRALEAAQAKLAEGGVRKSAPVATVIIRPASPGGRRGGTAASAKPKKSAGPILAAAMIAVTLGGAAYVLFKPEARLPEAVSQSSPPIFTKSPAADGAVQPPPAAGLENQSIPAVKPADAAPGGRNGVQGSLSTGTSTPVTAHATTPASGIQSAMDDLNRKQNEPPNPDDAWMEEGAEKVTGTGNTDLSSSTPLEHRGKYSVSGATDAELAEWNRDWTVSAPRDSMDDGARFSGRTDGGSKVLILAPFSTVKPATLTRRMQLPGDRPMQLSVRVRNKPHSTADWILKAYANDQPLSAPSEISIHHDEQQFEDFTWDLSAWKGRTVTLRLENHAGGTNPWIWEHSYWSQIKVGPLGDVLIHTKYNPAEASRGPVETGFVDLFSPAQASSWRSTESGGLSFNGGVATVYTRPGPARKGLIWFPKRMFRDFVLKVEFRMDTKRADSGIWLRIPEPGGKEADGPLQGSPVEVEINGYSISSTGTGSLAGKSAPSSLPLKQGDWNRFEITVAGTRHVLKLNDVRINEYEGGSGEPGYLALQNARGDGAVHYRNLWIKELTPAAAAQAVISSAVNADASGPAVAKPRPLGVPGDAREFNGTWYRYYPGKLLWRMAKKRCEDLRGRLAKVPDAPVNEFLTELSGGNCAWLGATNEKSKGQWNWLDGTPVSYSNWGGGQPDNTRGRENFLGLWGKGKWNDVPNDDSDIRGFICEWN